MKQLKTCSTILLVLMLTIAPVGGLQASTAPLSALERNMLFGVNEFESKSNIDYLDDMEMSKTEGAALLTLGTAAFIVAGGAIAGAYAAYNEGTSITRGAASGAVGGAVTAAWTVAGAGTGAILGMTGGYMAASSCNNCHSIKP